MQSYGHCQPAHQVWTDASGHFGCGAVYPTSGVWPAATMASLTSSGIAVARRELAPRVHPYNPGLCHMGSTLAEVAGGSALRQHGGCVCGECGLQQGATDHAPAALPFFIQAFFHLSVRAVHVPGAQKGWADAISRNHLSLFLAQVPGVVGQQELLPTSLMALLVNEQPSWTSSAWAQLFRHCFQQD